MDAFYALAVLACPVGMGVMMWFMMKGRRNHGGAPRQDTTPVYADFNGADPRQQELASLRKEVADLRDQVHDRHATSSLRKETR